MKRDSVVIMYNADELGKCLINFLRKELIMKLKPEKFLSCLFICVIVLFACSVGYKVALHQIEKMSTHESITSANQSTINIIDWAKLYPFESDSDSEFRRKYAIYARGGITTDL